MSLGSVVFFIVALILFVAGRWDGLDKALQRIANIATVLSLLVGVISLRSERFVIIDWHAVSQDKGSQERSVVSPTPSPIEVTTEVIIEVPTGISPSDEVFGTFTAGTVEVSRPTSQEYLQLPSLWRLVEGNVYPTSPGRYLFRAKGVNAQISYAWGAIWCGKNKAILTQILQPLSMNLLVNNRALSKDEVVEFYSAQGDWICYHWGTKLSHWYPGTTTVLELRYSLSEDVFDGENVTHKGDYDLVMEVSVP